MINFTSSHVDRVRQQGQDLKVFNNHVYEYKKGVRDLILTTESSQYRDKIELKLKKQHIDYAIQDVGKNKINVFFGAKQCIDVVKTFIHKKLSELSPEQDFILGTLLGYDNKAQCNRYLTWLKKQMSKGK